MAFWANQCKEKALRTPSPTTMPPPVGRLQREPLKEREGTRQTGAPMKDKEKDARRRPRGLDPKPSLWEIHTFSPTDTKSLGYACF